MSLSKHFSLANREQLTENLKRNGLGSRANDHLAMVRYRLSSLKGFIENLGEETVRPDTVVLLSHAFLDARLIVEGLALITVSSHELQGLSVSSSQRKKWVKYVFSNGIPDEFPGFFPVAANFEINEENGIDLWEVEDDNVLNWEQAKSILNKSGDFLHEVYKAKPAEAYAEAFEELEAFFYATQRLLKCCVINYPATQASFAIITDFTSDGLPQVFQS